MDCVRGVSLGGAFSVVYPCGRTWSLEFNFVRGAAKTRQLWKEKEKDDEEEEEEEELVKAKAVRCPEYTSSEVHRIGQ